jgi:4-hydroxy-3-polyprenylbenzoate decarboxylase
LDKSRWLVAVTGASGAPYGLRLLEAICEAEAPLDLIVSSHGWRLLAHETGIGSPEALLERLGRPEGLRLFDNDNRGARPASGSAPYLGMTVCPCSMGTVSEIAHGTSRSLIGRAADVALKERRKLIVVTRETPLSTVHLENLLSLSRMGVVVMPAAPGFYARPEGVDDMVDFIVARVLDHMGIEHGVGHRWSGEEERDRG